MTDTNTIASNTERTLEGIPASPGIAIAPVHFVQEFETAVQRRSIADNEIESELERFAQAVRDADSQLGEIEAMAREEVQDRAKIFEAMRMMLCDPALTEEISAQIKEHSTAEAATIHVFSRLNERFLESSDETIRTRVEDMHGLESQILAALSANRIPVKVCQGSVLAMQSLTPSDAVVFARSGAVAFAVGSGGINSHAAILARAFGIPMVAGLDSLTEELSESARAIVDGYTGRVVFNPSSETLGKLAERRNAMDEQRLRYKDVHALPSVTRDDVRITLAANLDMVDEVDLALENAAEEIALMRTEYLVMGRNTEPGMEEQLRYYRQIAQRAYPLPVTFRAFDIGSDKLAGTEWGKPTSPLGLRGIRLLLVREQLLRNQLEALLRASSMKNVRLMLPMVTSVEEIRTVKKIIADIREKLADQGVACDENMPLGTMIEVPAAALTADSIAHESAFFSLGTNDLAQYTLAVDREDHTLGSYYNDLHPAVLQLIRHSVLAAKRAGIPITVCGELAANPLATAVLIGLGVRRFSVPPAQLPPLKLRVRAINVRDAFHWGRAAIRMATAEEVTEYLTTCVGESGE